MCRTNDHCQSLSTCRRQMVSVIRIACGQTTVNKWALLYNPYKWYGPQTPLKTFKKIPPKFHDKAVQSEILWLNWNKINEVSILQSAHVNKVTLISLSCDRLKTQIPMHSNSIGCPKIFPLSAPVLYWLSHLICTSSLKAKNVDFHTAKNIQIQPTLFRYF